MKKKVVNTEHPWPGIWWVYTVQYIDCPLRYGWRGREGGRRRRGRKGIGVEKGKWMEGYREGGRTREGMKREGEGVGERGGWQEARGWRWKGGDLV